ncbi:MAG: glycogen/starch synthase [Chitinophagaceae bacterium]|nr:glycogen/starch synthase [Chitinophagaceae bacterium]
MTVDTKKRILIICNELSPYLELSEFANVLNQLAIKTFEAGIEIRIIMPRFGVINERRHKLHEVVRLSGINIIVDKDDYPLIIKVASLPNARLQVYFMDNDDYFKRKFTFRDEQEKFYADNADRAVFFSKSALETVKKFGWPPNVIHCHGWMSSLIPLYIKTTYKKEPVFSFTKTIFTAQTDQFKEKLNDQFVKKAMISTDIKEKDLDLFKDRTNAALTLGGAKYADIVIMGDKKIAAKLGDDVKASRTKKIIPFSEEWVEDISSLLDLYKSLTDS